MYTNDANKADIGHIHRSLENSEAREKIYYRLCDISPNGATPDELSEFLKITPINVSGALNGYGKRFSEAAALVRMGLARYERKELYRRVFEVYYATPYGLEIKDRVKEYGKRLSVSRGGAN